MQTGLGAPNSDTTAYALCLREWWNYSAAQTPCCWLDERLHEAAAEQLTHPVCIRRLIPCAPVPEQARVRERDWREREAALEAREAASAKLGARDGALAAREAALAEREAATAAATEAAEYARAQAEALWRSHKARAAHFSPYLLSPACPHGSTKGQCAGSRCPVS